MSASKGLPTWVYPAVCGAVFGVALDISGIRLNSWRWWMLDALCAIISTWSYSLGKREGKGASVNGCDTARERGGTI